MAEATIENQPSRLQRTWTQVRTGAGSVSRNVLKALTVDQVLGVLAVFFVPAGIATILLGWAGAARTPFLFEQIPYLISGGLLGVGLLSSGGLLYLGSWLARSAQQQRERDEQLNGLLRELRDELEGLRTGAAVVAGARSADGRTAGPGAGTASAAGDDAGTGEVPAAPFVVTATGTMFHRPDCSVVTERTGEELHRVTGEEPDLRPCGMCDPLDP